MITRKKLIKEFLEFYKSKNHKIIPNVNLIPENDPSVLFIIAGMQPIVPYLTGEKHPLGERLVNVQRCIRTIDIEEIGDSYHHTFFEMLGNWSLGDYFKKEAIEYSFDFLTKILKIPIEKLAITCFKGDEKAPKDNESSEIWKSLGISDERIVFLGKDNWWEPGGDNIPCGPCTEMFYWKSNKKTPKKFDPKDNTWVEIGNDVLMGYLKKNKKYFEAKQKNIDFGGGVERTLTILHNYEDNYLTEIWKPLITKIEKLSGKKYEKNKKEMRIIVDHIKAAIFIISDGIVPGNTEQGYILRRLIRRAVKYGKDLGMKNFISKLVEPTLKIYEDYPNLKKQKKIILNELGKEEEKFERTLEKGITKFKKIAKENKISGKDSFLLFQSYGFPKEMIKEECKKNKIKFSLKEFEKEFEKHQKLSRTASIGKFKSGLSDNSENTAKLHTATHLLLAALRITLKDKNIIQKGNNITSERLRLDFNFPRKLTQEEIQKIENLVNNEIQKSSNIKKEEMSPKKAKEKGALGIFEDKYGEIISVYSINNFSKEICAGPHVKNTSELGNFKIKKEESSSSGVRRIKAILK